MDSNISTNYLNVSLDLSSLTQEIAQEQFERDAVPGMSTQIKEQGVPSWHYFYSMVEYLNGKSAKESLLRPRKFTDLIKEFSPKSEKYQELAKKKEKEIKFENIIHLTEKQINSLIQPTVKNILRDNLCHFEIAKCLTTTQIRLITNYYSLFKQRRLRVEDMLRINHKKAKILFNPLIINLINQGELDFHQAKKFI